jgi:RHS repeat-associated protein
LHYLTRDHLGSVDSVTNAAGAVEVRLSFGAFGQRRNEAAWSGNPTSGDWFGITGTTRHGYTSHEMLDNLNLTHMNGRVYDQLIGQFTSADPFIDGVGSTQGWNRYAYVQNSPLRFTDPSGFEAKSPIARINGIETVTVTASRGSGGAGLASLVFGMQGNISRGSGGREHGGGGGAPGLDVIEEVVTTATRIRPGASISVSASGPKDDKPQCSRSVRFGNFLARTSQQAGDASARAIVAGAALAGIGIVTAQPELAGAGGALMQTGGILGITAGSLQVGSGIAQGFGAGDWSNATNAAASLGVGFALRTSIVGLPFADRGARSASQRALAASMNNTNTVAGGGYDLIINTFDMLGPHEVPCVSAQ